LSGRVADGLEKKYKQMKNENKIKLFLVDDDTVFLKLLEIEFLQNADFDIETYPTGEICIENLSHNPDVIILDYHLDGIDRDAMNGLDTLDKIKTFNPEIPVIMLSSQDRIDVAINCMHHKAFDYVVKSETAFLRLQKIIETIFEYKKMEKQLNWYMERM
jgi:two-component system OmpR family response regulator